jgi:hypothetical protein
MLIILVNLTTVSSRNAGLIVYDKPANDIPIESFMRSWETMSVIKATVVSDVDSRLVIDVDYLYSGDHGDLVTTCGGISFEGTRGDWSCKPSGVKKGRGMATLSFGLSSIAKEIECSTDFTFSIYDNKGIVFADYKIPYEKVWYKNKVGLFGSLSKLISFCPKYSN